MPATAEPEATEEAEDGEEPEPTRRPTLAPPAVTSVETDREALTALYNATGGPDWYKNGGWLSEGPLDAWYGVTTDGDGRVVELVLYVNDLSGEIPPELGSLVKLMYLELHSNELSGEIPPDLGGLANLESLSLEGNQLSGCVPASLEGRLIDTDLGGLPYCRP